MGNSCRTKLPHSEKDTAYVKQKEPPSSITGSIILQPTGELQLARPNQHVDFEQHVEIRISEESIEDLMGLDSQRRETKMNTLAKRNLNKIFLNMLE